MRSERTHVRSTFGSMILAAARRPMIIITNYMRTSRDHRLGHGYTGIVVQLQDKDIDGSVDRVAGAVDASRRR